MGAIAPGRTEGPQIFFSFFMNKFRKLGFIDNGKIEVHNSLLNVILYDKPEINSRDLVPPICLWNVEPGEQFYTDATRLRT